MNKIVKIHLILATIFSISCNSWSTNPNGNINKIDYYYDLNKINSYKNISRTTYVNVAKRMSYEQCQTIFNEKYTQLQNEINTAHSAFFAAFKEFYNAEYEYNSKVINDFLKKYSKYDNKYIIIEDNNLRNLLGYKIGDKIQYTELLQHVRSKVNYYMQLYLANVNKAEYISNLKEIYTNLYSIYSGILKYIKNNCNNNMYVGMYEEIIYDCENYNDFNNETIDAVTRNYTTILHGITIIERILQVTINNDIIKSDTNKIKLQSLYDSMFDMKNIFEDDYIEKVGFKSRLVNHYYDNSNGVLGNHWIDLYRNIYVMNDNIYYSFYDLKRTKYTYDDDSKLSLFNLIKFEKEFSNYIREITKTLHIKMVPVTHGNAQYIHRVSKATQALKKSLENIVDNIDKNNLEQKIKDIFDKQDK